MNPPFATLPVYFRALSWQGRVCVVEDLRRSAQRALRVEDGLADTERMVRAATAHRALIHPHIATVHEVDRADGMVWVVSELLSGGGLVPPLPPAEVHAILQTALRALAFAHRQGVIHGHLVPSNLLRAADGTWKITDFGLAVASGRMDRAQALAPETLERASVKGDLFAVGNLALAALGGGLGEDYPSWKYWFERALAPPARRFASAEEMLTALRDIALPAKGLQEDGPTHPGARPRRAVPPLSSPPMAEASNHQVPNNGPSPRAEASETPPPPAAIDVASGPFTALPSPAVGDPEAPPPGSETHTIKSTYTLSFAIFVAGVVVLAALTAGVWWMRSPLAPEGTGHFGIHDCQADPCTTSLSFCPRDMGRSSILPLFERHHGCE